MYKDTLKGQWKNLYSDFAQEYDRLLTQGTAPGCFAQWYETRIHRWQSVAYPEGIILEQTERAISDKPIPSMGSVAESRSEEPSEEAESVEPSEPTEQEHEAEPTQPSDPAAFSRELTDVMKDFRFRAVEPRPIKPMWQCIAAGAAAGLVSAGILALLHWAALRVIPSGIVVCVVVALGFMRSRDAERIQEEKRVKEEYVSQLRDYLTELTAVCDKYEVDV